MPDDPQRRFEEALQLDRSLSTPGREGLAGTAPSELYGRARAGEDITRPPDGSPPEQQPQWRKDFPIDWPNDQYVARRDFAKFLVLTSGSFAVGQAWIALKHLTRKTGVAPERVRIAALADVPVGSWLEFSYPAGHDPCILVRLGEDRIVAYSQECTHLSCAVIPEMETGLFRCPCHEGFFELATGRNVAGPPARPLARVALAVEDGQIFATGVDERTV
ncbi:MAG TPA: Rieske 2Fe-2S domain-containing protein [Myxococcales bacterium]|nr:Rieske 2Fe-2S domain-containing protein [Myxococcales bacterium]